MGLWNVGGCLTGGPLDGCRLDLNLLRTAASPLYSPCIPPEPMGIRMGITMGIPMGIPMRRMMRCKLNGCKVVQ